MPDFPSFRFSTAPMLDWTDRHCRRFWRIMTKRSLLYTEMVTSGAIIYGKNDYLAFDEAEHPVAVQLAGCDPKDLAVCAKGLRRRATTRSTSTAAAPLTGCRTAASARP